jgi:phenylalanyl-tRNA synthetase beta chain
MKIPLSWLKEYIDLTLSPESISKMLTSAGLEVEAVEKIAPQFDHVVVGRVISVDKHPQADKLVVAQVADDMKTYTVVCGAPNCRPGIKTALAKVGANLRDDSGKVFTVKKTKLRGVESEGMLCSAKELQLGDDHEGIMELPDSLSEGTDLASFYSETVFDIGLTPNLGHCASVLGIARELYAATEHPLCRPETSVKEASSDISKEVAITIDDKMGCPRYACRLIKDVIIEPSPDWMQKRLLAAGIRPINNVVDITNYVVLELGHPLHAFDFDRLDGRSIIVRKAKNDESFVTLDGKERVLNEQDNLICDANKPVALAGIMGGSNSEVTASTKNVLLEAAYFNPNTIRKTSKRLGLMTDASKRFERGTDPNQIFQALNRAAHLIQRYAKGQVSAGIIDRAVQKFEEKKIRLRLERVNRLLGTHLGMSEVENVFKRLQMPHQANGIDELLVVVPTYRVDISQEIDLIEEVARIYGYDHLIQAESPRFRLSNIPPSPIYLLEKEVRSRLVAEGLQEFITCNLIGPSQHELIQDEKLMPPASWIHVMNPTSIEQSILRMSLLPGLLQLVKYNFDHQNFDVSGFEIGRIHFNEQDSFKEQSVVGIILSGKSAPHHWQNKPEPEDFFSLKGIVENLLTGLNIPLPTYKPSDYFSFHSGRQAAIFVGALEIGSLGEIHPSVLRRLDVQHRIYFAELNLQDLVKVREKEQRMKDLPIYPSSARDWTITLPVTAPIQEVLDMIKGVSSQFLEKIILLDVYRSDKIGQDLQNVTFHFVYRNKEKTIEQEVVEAEHKRIIEEVSQVLKAKKIIK